MVPGAMKISSRRILLSSLVVLLALIVSVSPMAIAAEEVLDGEKPLVLMVYDQNCKKWCGEVRPILREIKDEFGDKIVLYELDFSEGVMKQSYETARRLGVGSFVKGVIDWIPTVGIFTGKRRLTKELPGKSKKETYVKCIEKALKSE